MAQAPRLGPSSLRGSPPRSGRRSLDQALEGLRFAHGDVGKHLAVERDPGLSQPIDQPPIGEAVGAGGRIDALDPQRAEGALLHLAVAISILAGFVDRLLGDADSVLAAAVIALGLLQHLAVAGMAGNAAFHTGHDGAPSKSALALAAIGQEILLHDLGVLVRQNHGPTRVPDEVSGALDHAVTLTRGLAFHLAGRRDFEALLGTALGLELGHLASLV